MAWRRSAAVAAHLAGNTWMLLDKVVKVESGRAMADRLQLARAPGSSRSFLMSDQGLLL